jgi:hypothetical protein
MLPSHAWTRVRNRFALALDLAPRDEVDASPSSGQAWLLSASTSHLAVKRRVAEKAAKRARVRSVAFTVPRAF